MEVYIIGSVAEYEGSLVAVAKDRDQVQKMLDEYFGVCYKVNVSDKEWNDAYVYPTTDDCQPRLLLFPFGD